MSYDAFINRILQDIKVELKDEFDQNFERKAFFNAPWKDAKPARDIGSLMERTVGSGLRGSITAHVDREAVVFESSVEYARIHNEGGIIPAHAVPITDKLRKWAWAMHKETGDEKYKWIALTKKTHLQIPAITMPQRQFIGDHPEVNRIVETAIDENMKRLLADFDKDIGSLP